MHSSTSTQHGSSVPWKHKLSDVSPLSWLTYAARKPRATSDPATQMPTAARCRPLEQALPAPHSQRRLGRERDPGAAPRRRVPPGSRSRRGRGSRHPCTARRRRAHAACRGLDRWQHGGQGAAIRHRRLGVVRLLGHRERRRGRGQWRGVVHRARRRGGDGDGEHDDRRGDLRRPRLGLVRNAAPSRAGSVHRRADGRPNARIPRQADPDARGQARDAGALFVPLLVLVFTAVAVATPAGRRSMSTHGPQGLAESAYAYSSQGQNNGSAFAGYSGFVQPVAGNAKARTGSRSRISPADG